MSIAYEHDISGCLSEDEHGMRLHPRHLSSLLSELDVHMAQIIEDDLGVLDLPFRTSDLGAISEKANYLRNNFDRIVLLGTGGSSLGSRALSEMSDRVRGSDSPSRAPQLDIITNVDPFYFNAFIDRLPERTAWVIVSKSGSTVETIMQFLTILPRVGAAISERAVIITESELSPLGQLATRYGIPILEHDVDIGGRYSVLSVVGILPAMIMGLSAEELRRGAGSIISLLRSGISASEFAPAIGAAISIGLSRYKGVSSNVMLAYSDRLGSLSRWYRQLWAESIGKDGQGMTPIYAMGPVDQHSQLQLWLDGPRDKMFTVMSAPFSDSSVVDGGLIDGIIGIEYLRNRSLSDLMSVSKSVTADILSDSGLPVRRVDLQRLDEYHVGALMMHFMLETIFAARLLGVDPFDQPAVESCKDKIRDLLDGGV